AAAIFDRAPPTMDVCARIAFEVDRFSVQVGGRISDSDLNWMAQHPSNRNCTNDCHEEQSGADCDKSLDDDPHSRPFVSQSGPGPALTVIVFGDATKRKSRL